MRSWRNILPTVVILGGGLFGLLSLSGWLQVQAVRLSYRAQAVRRELEQLDRREQADLRRLEVALSLARLDERARGRQGLALPRAEQIRLLTD